MLKFLLQLIEISYYDSGLLIQLDFEMIWFWTYGLNFQIIWNYFNFKFCSSMSYRPVRDKRERSIVYLKQLVGPPCIRYLSLWAKNLGTIPIYCILFAGKFLANEDRCRQLVRWCTLFLERSRLSRTGLYLYDYLPAHKINKIYGLNCTLAKKDKAWQIIQWAC